ncbi:MAG: c-type cytochrome domain-containing protein, partial [Armatimonadota bacterium]
MKRSIPLFGLCISVFAYPLAGHQTSATPPKSVNFDRDVLPILSQHCYKCHGPDAAKAAAGLRLDSFSSVAIAKGFPEKSLLIHRVSDKNPGSRMPPEDSGVKPLKPNEIAIIAQWIK